jgi:hypothetical protein
LQKQLKSKQRFLKRHIETGKQTQSYIFGLPIAEGSNIQAVEELLEKQKELQATIDVQTKTEETNDRMIQQMRDKQKRMQAIIVGPTMIA